MKKATLVCIAILLLAAVILVGVWALTDSSEAELHECLKKCSSIESNDVRITCIECCIEEMNDD